MIKFTFSNGKGRIDTGTLATAVAALAPCGTVAHFCTTDLWALKTDAGRWVVTDNGPEQVANIRRAAEIREHRRAVAAATARDVFALGTRAALV